MKITIVTKNEEVSLEYNQERSSVHFYDIYPKVIQPILEQLGYRKEKKQDETK